MIRVIRHPKRTTHTNARGESILSDYFYVGRPTTLGNIFTHKPEGTKAMFIVPDVKTAVEQYRLWFYDQLFNNLEVQAQVTKLAQHYHYHGELYLGCWCMDELSPSTKDHGCHATILKEHLLHRVAAERYFETIKHEILK